MFLFSLSFAGAQDTTEVGIEKGNYWEFKLVENTITDANGDLVEFAISASEGGIVEVGGTFDFEITEEVTESGAYDYTLDNGEITAVGTGDLDEFGSEAVFTDWEYWTTAAEDSALFLLTEVTITDGTDEFKAVSVIESDLIFIISYTVEIVYYKDTGVLKSMSITSTIDSVTEEMTIENQTGAVAEEVPGFGFIMSLLALLAVPVIAKKRK